MTSEPVDPEDRRHPVVVFAHALTDGLKKLAATPVWSMTPEQQREVLVELARAEAQVSALRLRVLAEAERSGAAQERAAASAADWVAIETRQTQDRREVGPQARDGPRAVLGAGVWPGQRCRERGAGEGDRDRALQAAEGR